MKILDTAIRWLASYFGIDRDTLDYFFKSSRLGRSDYPLPYARQLIPLGTRLWLRGWFNNQAIDAIHDWVLPYWATRQTNPTDRAFIARMSNPTMLNQNLRDWTMVGNLAREREAIIDPRGLITPWWNGWSLDAWIAPVFPGAGEGAGVKVIYPSRLRDAELEQRLYENLPIVVTAYEVERLRVKQETFAIEDADKREWVVASYTVENPRNEPRRVTLYLALRPFNPEGASLIERIEYRVTNATGVFFVNDALAVVVPEALHVAVSNFRGGDVAFQIPALNGGTQIECEVGLATALAQYELDLPSNTSRTLVGLMPMSRERETAASNEIVVPAALKMETAQQLREQTITLWQEKLAQGMRVSVPDERMNNAFEASKTHLLLLHDGDSITPGPYLYHYFWIRDAAFTLSALDTLGYHDEVARVLRKIPRQIRKDGFFNSQEGEWDANGQAIWTLIHHARLSGDWETAREQYWGILNLAHWIDITRQKTKQGSRGASPQNPPRAGGQAPRRTRGRGGDPREEQRETAGRPLHWGLLPAGFSAEHFGPADYYYWDDFWGAAGLREAMRLAEFLGQQEDAKKLRVQFDTFRSDIDGSLARVAEKFDSPIMPVSPYRHPDAAMVGSLAALYPLRLFEPHDPRITATLDALMENAWLEDAFYHAVGHTAFGTYLSLGIAQCLLLRRDPRAWKVIEWVLRHASPTYTWAEGIHPITRRGGMGDSPHGWASADWVHTIRNALLFEAGNVLGLTPVLPREWTAETTVIRVEEAATYFGNVSFTLAFGAQNSATLAMKTEWRVRPDYVEWNFPFALKQASSEERGLEIIGSAVRIPPEAKRVVATW